MFDPKAYWRQLVSDSGLMSLEEVGHPDMGTAFNTEAYALRRGALIKALEDTGCFPPASVFEAAFGVGYYLDVWRGLKCRSVAGIDISERAHAHAARAYPGYELCCGDISELHQRGEWPGWLGRFQVVTAIDVLYHVVDDALARKALQNLAALVAPGGVILFSEKFTPWSTSYTECEHVVRRSLGWYTQILSDLGFTLEKTRPIFWSMDPPVNYGGQFLSSRLAYLVWGTMRAAIKFLPRNGFSQNLLGRAAGRVGRTIDSAIVPMLRQTPNLTFAVYRKR